MNKWEDKEVAAARKLRWGVVVDGVAYESVRKAFIARNITFVKGQPAALRLQLIEKRAMRVHGAVWSIFLKTV